MTCREFVEFLWRYLDNALAQEERTTFDQHMATCPHCTKYLQQYEATVRVGKTAIVASTDAIPTEVPEELVQAILQSRVKSA